MEKQTLNQRVKEAFGTPEDREQSIRYLGEIKDGLAEGERSIGRSVSAALLFGAFFELISRASIQKVSFSRFEVSDLSLIHKLIPVVVAYFTYSYMIDTVEVMDLRRAYYAVSALAQPKVNKTALDTLTQPRAHAISFSQSLTRGAGDKGYAFLSGTLVAFIIIAPFALAFCSAVSIRG